MMCAYLPTLQEKDRHLNSMRAAEAKEQGMAGLQVTIRYIERDMDGMGGDGMENAHSSRPSRGFLYLASLSLIYIQTIDGNSRTKGRITTYTRTS